MVLVRSAAVSYYICFELLQPKQCRSSLQWIGTVTGGFTESLSGHGNKKPSSPASTAKKSGKKLSATAGVPVNRSMQLHPRCAAAAPVASPTVCNSTVNHELALQRRLLYSLDRLISVPENTQFATFLRSTGKSMGTRRK